MKFLKKSLDEAFSVMGIIFILTIVLTFIFDEPKLLLDGRVYFLLLFGARLIFRYIIFKYFPTKVQDKS